MRRMSVWIGLVVGFCLSASPAVARPEVFPPEDLDFIEEFEAGFPCAFPVDAHVTGKEGAIFFENRAILTAPGLKAELTNVTNGETMSFVATGVFHDEYLSDDLVRTTATGRSVLFGFFDGEPGMFLTIGPVVVEWPLDDPLSYELIEDKTVGRMIDICELLAG